MEEHEIQEKLKNAIGDSTLIAIDNLAAVIINSHSHEVVKTALQAYTVNLQTSMLNTMTKVMTDVIAKLSQVNK